MNRVLFKMIYSFIISLMILLFTISNLNAQGKVDQNTLRLKGGLLIGNVHTDLEKRIRNAGYFNGEANFDWSRTNGMSGLNNVGFDYFHSLNNDLFSNVFIGAQMSSYDRDYEWKSLYYSGIGIKESNNRIGYGDITMGVTISAIPNVRILPKYVLRSINQHMQGNYFGIGNPISVGNQEIRAKARSGMFGVGLEFDFSPDITFYADFLSFGHNILSGSGNFNNDYITLSTNGFSFATVNGNYITRSNKIVGGASFLVIPNLRLYVALDSERIYARSNSVLPIVVNNAGFDVIASIGQYLASTNEERISISGLKFGVTYDIGI
jgi:hypothetical protein